MYGNVAHALLGSAHDLKALFASNDLPAVGAFHAAADLGACAAQLSILGITDIQLAHQIRPALTTVAIAAAEATACPLTMLLSRMPDPTGRARMPMSRASPPRLVARASTGLAPKRSR
ncbi:MAG TPA: substrate-binding domain-containing protein [Burkholderiaceae bacterium]|nr:substrate-binding domain-containing protein [Burkholderiaceae bacterium]